MRQAALAGLVILLAACHRAPGAAELYEAGARELANQSAPAAGRAVEKFEQALKLTADPAMRAKIQRGLVQAMTISDPAGAVAAAEKLVELARQTGDAPAILDARVTLALAVKAPPDETIDKLRALLVEARTAGAREAELDAAFNLGSMLGKRRKPTEAIPVLLGALELLRAAPNPEREAEIELILGYSYQSLFDADEALQHGMRALAVAREARLPLPEAGDLYFIGIVYHNTIRDMARALIYYSAARIAFVRLGLDRGRDGLAARRAMADVQRLLGDPAGALAALGSVLADSRALGSLTLLGTLVYMIPAYRETGRIAEAKEALAEALALGKKLDDKHWYHLALLQGARVALAERHWREAEELATSVRDFFVGREAEVKEERLKLTFSSSARVGQQVLLEAVAGQGDWSRALAASERLRSRRLLAALGSAEIADGAEVQALLDPDTTMVEYAFADSRAYAFVVDHRSNVGVDLGPAKDVQAAARAWVRLASDPSVSPERLEAVSGALAELILRPLAPKLHGRRLAIVPDKELQYVAFAALPLSAGQRLIERFELVHVTSASVLRALRAKTIDRPPPSRELALLADPIFDRGDARLGLEPAPPPATLVATRAGEQLGRLASTHAEAQAIAALFPKDQVFVAEGAAATRAAALGAEVSGARFVHLATHALLDDVDPDRSALVFTQVDATGAPVDGLVRVPDIEQAHLAADLVVLSACRTAIGKSFDGEGLVGLTRAFLRAGVPRVVSSLWQVEDVATAALMARFYRGLVSERRSPADALRQAQLAGLDTAPRLWASFVFYGDWR